jgi:hypothetical protein
VLLVFNKIDVARHEFALDWMADYENFGKVGGQQWQWGLHAWSWAVQWDQGGFPLAPAVC